MSPGGVASDSSVTLTLADAQGMLDGVTLNLNTQVRKKHISKHTFYSHASEASVGVMTDLRPGSASNAFLIPLTLQRATKRV